MITCTFENGGKANLRHVVVHAIAEKDSALLLVKRSQVFLEGGKWSLPSGFLDRDETAGAGALRELKEETGWEGKIITPFLVNTSPHRPHEDRQNVAFYFLVKPVIKTGKPDTENTKISWVPIAELPPFDSFAFDHGEAVERYLEYRTKSFLLPLFR